MLTQAWSPHALQAGPDLILQYVLLLLLLLLLVVVVAVLTEAVGEIVRTAVRVLGPQQET